MGRGFDLTAGTVAVPAGTVLTITSSGVNIDALSTAPLGLLNVSLGAGASEATLVLQTDLAPGTTVSVRSTLSISAAWAIHGVVTLPSGFDLASGAKATAGLGGTLPLTCGAS